MSKTSRFIALWATTLALAGCAQAAPPASPSAAPSVTEVAPTTSPTSPEPSATDTPSVEVPTSGPSPSAATGTFESNHYRYRITLPPEAGAGAWSAAVRPWDGRQMLVRVGPFLDRVLLPEGGLWITATPTTKDVDAFAAEIAELYVEQNGCRPGAEIEEAEINGVPARAWTQTCPEGLKPHRVVMVNDGYGILAFITANPAAQTTALDRLIELLGGLEWLPA